MSKPPGTLPERPLPTPLQAPPSPSPSPPSRVADLGERALIDWIRSRVPAQPPWLTVGLGDDAAVIEPPKNQLEVVTSDGLVEGVHFDWRFSEPADVGFKALAVNLSDLAAMGAAPRAALLSLALPADMKWSDVEAIVDSFLTLAGRYGATLIGGNVTRSPGPLFVDVTALGSVRRRRTLLRSGARPGDELFVSGLVGSAAAGLDWLRIHSRALSGTGNKEIDLSAARDRYRRPEPRVRLGVLLGRNGAASACVDLSDGLAEGVRQLAAPSGVGAVLESDALPIANEVRAWFENRELDPISTACSGGDDYELLFTVPPKRKSRFMAVQRLVKDLPITRIGVITADSAVILRRDGRQEPLPGGFEHFA